MTAHLALHGRLGQAPKAIETKSGKPMAVASIAADPGDDGDAPLWFGVVAFGALADQFLRHGKGDPVSAIGRVQRRAWRGSDGEERVELQIIAEAIVSARTVRPGGGRKREQGEGTGRAEPAPDSGRELVDDGIGF